MRFILTPIFLVGSAILALLDFIPWTHTVAIWILFLSGAGLVFIWALPVAFAAQPKGWLNKEGDPVPISPEKTRKITIYGWFLWVFATLASIAILYHGLE